MNVILFGATGMIGKGALIECLEDQNVKKVLSVSRRPCGLQHDKLTEVLHSDFLDFSPIERQLKGYDACLYCLGISSAGMPETKYRQITVDFSTAAGEVLVRLNPQMRLCFISGASTNIDSRQMWARVKGEAEAAMLKLPWRSAHMFRPAAIFPRKGVVSGVRSYRIGYALTGWAYPLFRKLAPSQVTTSSELGRALINVARDGHPLDILEGSDINAAA